MSSEETKEETAAAAPAAPEEAAPEEESTATFEPVVSWSISCRKQPKRGEDSHCWWINR